VGWFFTDDLLIAVDQISRPCERCNCVRAFYYSDVNRLFHSEVAV